MSMIAHIEGLVEEVKNEDLFQSTSMEKCQVMIDTLQLDKMLGHVDGWRTRSFIELFDVVGDDFLKVVEQVNIEGFRGYLIPHSYL